MGRAVGSVALGMLALIAFVVAYFLVNSTGRWYVDAVVPAAAALALAAIALGRTARRRLRVDALGRSRLASFGVVLGASTLVMFCGVFSGVALDSYVAASATDGSALVIRPCSDAGETTPPPSTNEDGSFPAIPRCSTNEDGSGPAIPPRSTNDASGDEARDGRLSLHEYTAKAGTICNEEMARWSAAGEGLPYTLENMRRVMKQQAAVLETLRDRLSDLRPPERVQSDVDQMLRSFTSAAAETQNVSEEAENMADAGRRVEQNVGPHVGRAIGIAYGIGIEGCEPG